MKNKVGIVCVGQAGGNIGKLLKLENFDVVFINSSRGDLETLSIDENLKYHIKNGLGCAKDRNSAKEVAKEDFVNINKFIEENLKNKELYYIVSSSGGGTGSGITPTLANIFTKGYGRNTGVITILPSERDTLQSKINSYECLKELTEIEKLSGCFILDNNNKNDIYHINKKFVSLFNKIFDYKKYETERGNIDEAEILKLLNTSGMINIATCNNNENTQKLIENINNGIFAKLEEDAIIKYLGLSKGIKFEEKLFFEKIGKYLDKFENQNKEYTLAILSGLTFPLKRIKSLQEDIEKEKDRIINLNTEKSLKLEELDFLNQPKKEKEEEKNMSQEDILNLFF